MKDKLNMTYYSGQDLYSDGDVEQEILKAVQSGEDIEECLQKGNSWPFLYHLSNIRENILDWYDFNPKGSLLEIGSGCGALTGLFCKKVDHVVAIDLSKQRSMINATRNQAYDNLTIMLGNFEDIRLEEKFDYVTLIGVFEYSICYISSDNPFMDMLERIKRLLKPDGKLFLAIENKYGLKYFAGASEDHTGRCFDGLENYASVDRVRTFSHNTLEKMLENAGFSNHMFYYPMPDYKLPSEIYSDRYLPSFGSIRNACVAYDRDRYELLDERLAYDSICEDGMFGDFANSFLVVSGISETNDKNTPQTGSVCKSMPKSEKHTQETVEYAKYNRLRAPRFQVKTRIILANDGTRRVEKEALRDEAQKHIDRLSKNYKKLMDYGFGPVPAGMLRNENGRAVFPYVEGESLAKKMNRYLGKKEPLLAAMHKAIDRIYGPSLQSGEQLVAFRMTKQFEHMFGVSEGSKEHRILTGMKALRVSNIDSILSNFVQQPDGTIVCLDYEWVFDFPIPAEYLMYRTVFYYFSENREYIEKDILEQDFLSEFGMTEEKIRIFRRMDERFQQYVHGKGRKYIYTSNYEKKTWNIGKNIQGGEGWFLSIINDIVRLNHEIGWFRRDLVVCSVKMHRKSLFLDKHKGVDRYLTNISDTLRKVKRLRKR